MAATSPDWLVVTARVDTPERDRRAGAGRTHAATAVIPRVALEGLTVLKVHSEHDDRDAAVAACRRKVGAP